MTVTPESRTERAFSREDFFTFLIDRGLVALAWADEDFVVQGATGKLAWWISGGDNLTQDLPPFIGLEDDLRELMDDFRPSLVLSNIGMNVGVGDSEKASIEVFWQDAARLYVLVLHRLGGQPEFEADMARQLRGRRLAEENIAAMQRRVAKTQGLLDIISEHAPIGLAVHDGDDQLTFMTKRWLEHLPSYKGRFPSGCTHPFDAGMENARQGHENRGWPTYDQQTGDACDAALGDLAWSHRPWLNTTGAVAGVVSAVHPVGEMASEMKNLRDRVADLERVNADLESFASLLAHDVRAPMVALRTKLSSADSGPITLSDVDATLSRVLQIANGLLEYATGSGLSGPVHEVDVEAMVRRIADDCSTGTLMTFVFSGHWPIISTAVAPLDIVLRNLMQNAVRHHDTGEGTVHLLARPAAESFIIEIADDGPGIAPEFHEQVFAPLVKGTEANETSSGLGLAFVRRAVTSVGGHLELESNPSERRGSMFRLKWPIQRVC